MPTTQNGGGQASSKRELALRWRDEDIVSAFKQTPAVKPDGNAVTGFFYPPQQPAAYVKFGMPSVLKAERRNHEYVFKALRDMPSDQTRGIRVPEIYRTIEIPDYFFIVMEYIPGWTLAQLQDQKGWESRKGPLINSIAKAIKLLMSIPAPTGQKPGPVGGGKIRHSLFKDDNSFCEYSSVDELEKHLNKVSTLRDKTAPTMTLEKSLCFYYSDFYANNFIFTDAGEVCIIDFDQAGFLPPSFMSFALAESRWPPGHWVRDILRLPEHNLPAMKNVYYWFSIGVAWLDTRRRGKKIGKEK